MNEPFFTNLSLSGIVADALHLSDLFVHFHTESSETINFKEEELKIILPFLFFHPQLLRLYRSQINSFQYTSFRLTQMRELFESPILDNSYLPNTFEECRDSSTRLLFLLNSLENGHDLSVFRLHQYDQYFSDAIPILYARFSDQFPMATFISASVQVGDMSILSLSFCFPNFICPIFRAGLRFNTSPTLISSLVSLSPNHRTTLLHYIQSFHQIYTFLSIKLFPDTCPLLIIPHLGKIHSNSGIEEIKQELYLIRERSNLSPKYYLAYSMCCGILSSITEEDLSVLTKCKDDILLICLSFLVDNVYSNVFNDFIRRFQKTSESTSFMLCSICDKKLNRNEILLEKIQKHFGNNINWEIKSTFSNYFFKQFDISQFDISSFGDGNSSLYIIGTMIDDIGAFKSIEYIPQIFNSLTYLDPPTIESINSIIGKLGKTIIPDKQTTYNEFYRAIDICFYNVNFDDIISILNNPSPAIAYTILLLKVEEITNANRMASTKHIHDVPIRFIYYSSLNFEGAKSIFLYFSNLCFKFASNHLVKSQFMTMDKTFFLNIGSHELYLQKLKESPLAINELRYNEWKVFHFVRPFQFVMDTFEALKGPIEVNQLHEAFDFPNEYLENRFLLSIIFHCIIDISCFYEKKNLHDIEPNSSATILLYKVFDILKNDKIDHNVVCQFLYDFLSISPVLVETILFQGFDRSLMNFFAKNIRFFDFFWPNIKQFMGSESISKEKKTFIFEFMSYLAMYCNNRKSRQVCIEILSRITKFVNVDENNISMILEAITRIFNVFPEIVQQINNALFQIRDEMVTLNPSQEIIALINLTLDNIIACTISN